MSQWAKIKFFYDSISGSTGSLVTATSAADSCPVENIYNMLETNVWMSSGAAQEHYIAVDLQTHLGYPAKSADYLAVLGHNLKSVGTLITLQYSADNLSYADAFTAFSPQVDTVILKEFTNPGAYRYWRLKITGMTDPAYMAVCIWGLKTELDYATASYDPHGQEVKANVSLSCAGYVAGVHAMYTERSMEIRFNDADASLYSMIKQWWETSGLKNFFVAWESANSPEDVFLMRPDTRFNNPLNSGGAYRDIAIRLTGRKE